MSPLLYIRCEEHVNTTVEASAAPPKRNFVIGSVCYAVIPLSPLHGNAAPQEPHPRRTLTNHSSSPSQLDAQRSPISSSDSSPATLCTNALHHLPAPLATSPDTTGLEAQPFPADASLQQPAASCPLLIQPERAAAPPPDAQIAAGSNGPERQPCYLCMDRRADAVLLECGHGGICAACAAALWRRAAAAPAVERRCPLCRLPFVGVMLIVSEAAGTVRA